LADKTLTKVGDGGSDHSVRRDYQVAACWCRSAPVWTDGAAVPRSALKMENAVAPSPCGNVCIVKVTRGLQIQREVVLRP
jgi:hypothetical protein